MVKMAVLSAGGKKNNMPEQASKILATNFDIYQVKPSISSVLEIF
jgi:hypothetical protein